MDTAVAIVEAYLRVNGYFTIAEYSIVEEMRGGQHRTLTDIDVLAFRFPAASRELQSSGRRTVDPETHQLDPVLAGDHAGADMIIGEVKEWGGRLNQGARDPIVLRATLIRFGCCSADEADTVVSELLKHGRSRTRAGHQIRMVVFASTLEESGAHKFEFVSLSHALGYLSKHIEQHWQVLRHSQLKDPALAFLVTLEKARRGATAAKT